MSSPGRPVSSPGKSPSPFADVSTLNLHGSSSQAGSSRELTALSFEFVAKPEVASSAAALLLSAIQPALEQVPGFAGALVMTSDQEARLITVVAFWRDCETQRDYAKGVRRVHALIGPYLDRCLRVRTMVAHLPAPQALPAELKPMEAGFVLEHQMAQGANACAA